MERLGIIGAMASEITHLTEQMEEKTVTRAAGLRFYDGTLMGCPVVVAECGVGKVCAAVCAQVMIDRFRVTGLVNTGVAGGLHPELKVGDIVIGTDAVQHDFDLTATGAVKGYLFGEDESVPTRFHSDPTLVAAFKRAADKILTGGKTYREGTIASGDIFVADPGAEAGFGGTVRRGGSRDGGRGHCAGGGGQRCACGHHPRHFGFGRREG